jgi:hypothetical protein
MGRVVFDEKTHAMKEIKPIYFNHAFPRLIAPRLEAGARVRVTGVKPDGPVEFAIPRSPVKARVKVGKGSDERPLPLDQIGIDVDKKQVFLTYRYAFRYFLKPLEVRSCELLSTAAPGKGG